MVRSVTWLLLACAVAALAAAVGTSQPFIRWRQHRRIARLLKQFANTVDFDEGASRL
jgi:Flp pilus assembly protein TadB